MPSIPEAELLLTSLIVKDISRLLNSCNTKLYIIDLEIIFIWEMSDLLLFDKFKPTLAKYSLIRFKNLSLSVSHVSPLIFKKVGCLLRELFLP